MSEMYTVPLSIDRIKEIYREEILNAFYKMLEDCNEDFALFRDAIDKADKRIRKGDK